ncbi:MAG: helix-hairpin-helix domain-containing protein [Bryobacteraceae bacterium]
MRTLLVAVLLAPAAASQVPLPDGPSRKTVEKLCSGCHGVAILLAPRRTREAWRKSVDQMAALGVEGTDEEFDSIVDYLVRHFGKINVNRASAKELQEVLDLTPGEAAALVRHRQASGDFKQMEDLRKAAGLDAKKLAACRDRVLFR